MTIRIETGELVALLSDLIHTAADPEAGAIGGVLLHVDRGYRGVEPGRTSLLVGTSTTGRAVGHTHTWCSGTLPPMLWPVAAVKAVIDVFKPLAKQENHATEIRREGDGVTLAEDTDLFGNGLTLSLELGNLNDYPRSVWSLLGDVYLRPALRDADGNPEPAQPRTDIPTSLLDPFLKVAKRRKMPIELYRYHQRLALKVQIGPTYIGALLPSAWPEGADGSAPSADVYAPDLPKREEVSTAATTE